MKVGNQASSYNYASDAWLFIIQKELSQEDAFAELRRNTSQMYLYIFVNALVTTVYH